jgi:hypothetical protein
MSLHCLQKHNCQTQTDAKKPIKYMEVLKTHLLSFACLSTTPISHFLIVF